MAEREGTRPSAALPLRATRSSPLQGAVEGDINAINGRSVDDAQKSKPKLSLAEPEVTRTASDPIRTSEREAARMRRSIDVFDLDLVKRRDRRLKASLGWMESKGRERVKKVVLNVLLFPFHLSWWKRRVPSSKPYLYQLAALYILQAISIFRECFFGGSAATPVEFVELMMPLLLLGVMAILMGQAAASMIVVSPAPAPPTPPLGVVTSGKDAVHRPIDSSKSVSPTPSDVYRTRNKIARRASKSDTASVNNDSNTDMFTNDEGETGSSSSSEESDDSESSSDSSNESEHHKHHPLQVAVRRSSLLGVSPLPQHLGAPHHHAPQQSQVNERISTKSPRRKDKVTPTKELPPLPHYISGQSVSPQNSTAQKRKHRSFFASRLVGGRGQGSHAHDGKEEIPTPIKAASVDDDSDTDDEVTEVLTAREVELNATNDTIGSGGLQRDRLFSQSMEDILDAVKSVHWSAHGPEKVFLTPQQIRSELERKVFEARQSDTYRHLAFVGAVAVAIAPVCYRIWLFGSALHCRLTSFAFVSWFIEVATCPLQEGYRATVEDIMTLVTRVFGNSALDVLGVLTSLLSSFIMAWVLLGHVAGAVETFKRRYMYAKYFSRLTSSRKARRAGLPYFRLHKVDHIKVWLSLRSRRADLDRECIGPYRASDTIAHFLFMVAIFLVGVVAFRAMQNISGNSNSAQKQSGTLLSTLSDWILGIWALLLAIFVQRIMALASKTHERFMDTSVLLTEELNIHVRLLRKPHKKDELNACNQMLKVASSLIKELEGGKSKKGQGGALVLDPWLYSIVRVVLLSALGALSSDLFGFRVRLWKI